jgi:hypothetical protein
MHIIFRNFPIVLIGLMACQNRGENHPVNHVKEEVLRMADSVSKSITSKGVSSWLDFFDDRTDFFMVSGGHLIFPNYDSARNFINQVLVHNIRSIQLSWDVIRVDSLTNELATMSAGFNEKLIDSAGKPMTSTGYFTAVTRLTPSGWKFANANWSLAQTN